MLWHIGIYLNFHAEGSGLKPGQVGQFLLGFNPGNDATHQQPKEDTATESQEGGLAQNSNQEEVQQTVQQCMNRMIPEMVQSVLSILEQ